MNITQKNNSNLKMFEYIKLRYLIFIINNIYGNRYCSFSKRNVLKMIGSKIENKRYLNIPKILIDFKKDINNPYVNQLKINDILYDSETNKKVGIIIKKLEDKILIKSFDNNDNNNNIYILKIIIFLYI